MSPPLWPHNFPLNTKLVPGEMYSVDWRQTSFELTLYKKPYTETWRKELLERRRTTHSPKELQDLIQEQKNQIAGNIKDDDIVMYIETIHFDGIFWYKLLKSDMLGYVKSEQIGLTLLTKECVSFNE